LSCNFYFYSPFTTTGAWFSFLVQQLTVWPWHGMEQHPFPESFGLQQPQPDQQHWSLSEEDSASVRTRIVAKAVAKTKRIFIFFQQISTKSFSNNQIIDDMKTQHNKYLTTKKCFGIKENWNGEVIQSFTDCV